MNNKKGKGTDSIELPNSSMAIVAYFFSLGYSSVGIVTGLQADNRGSIPGRGKRFFFLHSVKTGYGALLPGVKSRMVE
jgi:hypothetical protein